MIYPIPLNFQLLCLVPESFLTITLGAMFLSINVKWSKILMASFAHGLLMCILINNYPMEVQILLNFITLVIFTSLITSIDFKILTIALGSSMAISMLLKGTSQLVLLSITNITVVELLMVSRIRLAFLITYFFQLILIIALVRKYKFTLKLGLNI